MCIYKYNYYYFHYVAESVTTDCKVSTCKAVRQRQEGDTDEDEVFMDDDEV